MKIKPSRKVRKTVPSLSELSILRVNREKYRWIDGK